MKRSNLLRLLIICGLVGLLGTFTVLAQDTAPAPSIPIELADMPDFAGHWQLLVSISLSLWGVVTMLKPSLKSITGNNSLIQLTALGIGLVICFGASRLFKAYPFGETAQSAIWTALLATVGAMITHSGGKWATTILDALVAFLSKGQSDKAVG